MDLSMHTLTKRYKGKTAVDGLNLTLTGGVYGLLGPNGSGKTTLMRMITGILMPSAGRVTLGGQDIQTLGESYRDMLGYLPQEFGFYRGFTGLDTLRYIAALKGLDKPQTERKVAELIERDGLADDAKRRVSGYSGGMRRRLGIAQALLNDPDILILDEPTSGLDPQERVRFRNMISQISASRLVLLSTHIVSDVEHIAGQVLLLREGRLLMQDTPAGILQTAQGCVWLARVPQGDPAVLQGYLVSNLRNLPDGRLELRIVSDERPALPDVAPAEPSLENVYLYHFRQASGS